MPSGRRTTERATKRQCREMVELMAHDPTIGITTDGVTYSVKGTTGKYLIIQRMMPSATVPGSIVREILTLYKTDFVDFGYESLNKAKVVKVYISTIFMMVT